MLPAAAAPGNSSAANPCCWCLHFPPNALNRGGCLAWNFRPIRRPFGPGLPQQLSLSACRANWCVSRVPSLRQNFEEDRTSRYRCRPRPHHHQQSCRRVNRPPGHLCGPYDNVTSRRLVHPGQLPPPAILHPPQDGTMIARRRQQRVPMVPSRSIRRY